MDPDLDPGGPKTCGSGSGYAESGSATLGDSRVHKATYAPMIYTAPRVMFFDAGRSILGEVGGGWRWKS